MLLIAFDHPQYNPALEVLCLLSPRPVRLEKLANDLQTSVQRMRRLLHELQEQGHTIRVEAAHAQVLRAGWPRALAVAQRYWRLIYSHNSGWGP